MSLEEYKRKRKFEATPEPPPKLEKKPGHRFVVQKHRATRLHYDFRLEMEGVLKSWAVPKGPSLDPADKRLAMHVEDHPVSYFDFEGVIPEDNYGAGTVMVWDVGTWEPLSPVPVQGKFVPGADTEAAEMLNKGDLKFRLHGKKLHGDFALVRMRSWRAGSKGTEWLLIKKRDEHVVEDYDIAADDVSALSGRTLPQIAGDHDAEWVSRPATRRKLKAAWLADAVAKLDSKKALTTEGTEVTEGENKKNAKKTKPDQHHLGDESMADVAKQKKSPSVSSAPSVVKGLKSRQARALATEVTEVEKKTKPDHHNSGTESVAAVAKQKKSPSVSSVPSVVKGLPGAVRAPMPKVIHPMLATPAEKPFDDPHWLFEIKWDGYRAVAFLENGSMRLVSRNQNDLTAQYPELAPMAGQVKARTAVLDGEVVALDEAGRSSFSLMQQRAGFSSTGRRKTRNPAIPVLYYAFDLLYLDGYDLRPVALEQRKAKLASLLEPSQVLRYSDHHVGQGVALFEAAKQTGLEGILAKRRASVYVEQRSREWQKIKITRRLECVIGGYTEPEGSRQYFGSVVLGLYGKKGELVHIGQAGTGFDQKMLEQMWTVLRKLETPRNPFASKVQALRKVHWVQPKLVAEIKFAEWTHEGQLRAPVFLGLRTDKEPKECRREESL
jgi:bifunctional non-homologous end joining protein LigD